MGWCDNFILECEEDGSYATIQCCDNYCWCVTEMGVEIPGTSVYESVPDCDEPYLTYVPDDGFELWIENNISGASNGNANDNYVFSSALQISDWPACGLFIQPTDGPIFDLTGIEDFSICQLQIWNTYVSAIDFSNVDFSTIALQSIVIEGNQYLEQIILPEDTLGHVTIEGNAMLNNIVFNPSFGFSGFTLGVGQPNLCQVSFQGSVISLMLNENASWDDAITLNGTEIYQLDFSNLLTAPYQTEINLNYELNINEINLNNDISIYNWDLNAFTSLSNPYVCVELNSQSDVDFVQGNNEWPETFIYSTDCSNDDFDCSSINVMESTIINKALIKTIDILGRETTNKGVQLHIYDDGSVEKKYLIK